MLGQIRYKPNSSYVIDDAIFINTENESYSSCSRLCVFAVGPICRLMDCNLYYGKRCMQFKCRLYTEKMSKKYIKLKTGSFISKEYQKHICKKNEHVAYQNLTEPVVKSSKMVNQNLPKNKKKEQVKLKQNTSKAKTARNKTKSIENKFEKENLCLNDELALLEATKKMAEFINNKYRC